jgi:hypothetical protein
MKLALYIRPSRLTPNSLFSSLAFLSRRHLPDASPGTLTIMLQVSHYAKCVASGGRPPAGVRFHKTFKMRAAYRWLQRAV